MSLFHLHHFAVIRSLLPKTMSPCRRFLALSVVVSVLGAYGIPAVDGDYSHKSSADLIDELTLIDSQTPGIDSAAMYGGFIANDTPGKFEMGVLGVAPPKVPPQMRELVRRGPEALSELIRHLDDKRPTKLEVGNKPSGKQVGVDWFMFMYFSDEYDPRAPRWFNRAELERKAKPMEKNFTGRYTVKVADLCYVIIGQIVNRRLLAVRYQASAGLVVNSPIEAPELAEEVKSDWGKANAEVLRQSLLEDIRGAPDTKQAAQAKYKDWLVNPALERLRFYFPDTYAGLQGDDVNKRIRFENQETEQRHTQPQ